MKTLKDYKKEYEWGLENWATDLAGDFDHKLMWEFFKLTVKEILASVALEETEWNGWHHDNSHEGYNQAVTEQHKRHKEVLE